MTIERTEILWIESRSDYSADEVAALSGLPTSVIDELIERGVLPVATITATVSAAMHFEAEAVTLARAAGRLRDHFELDANGLAVAVSLLRRVRRLEARMAAMSAHANGAHEWPG